MKNRFWGSNLALALGGLLVLAGLSKADVGTAVSGMVTLFFAGAYKSAKKRKLGAARNSSARIALEYTLAVAAVSLVVLQKNLVHLIATDPVPNLVVPLWGLAAFAWIALKQSPKAKETTS